MPYLSRGGSGDTCHACSHCALRVASGWTLSSAGMEVARRLWRTEKCTRNLKSFSLSLALVSFTRPLLPPEH